MLAPARAEPTPTVRPDSRLIYVSMSTGSDLNDGFAPARPKQTLAAGASLLRDGYPDWLLLRRGDEWNEGFGSFSVSGRSEAEPIVVSSYGSGESNPSINPSDPAESWPDGENWVMSGVDFPGVHQGEVPVLIPGDGWAGPTNQPGVVGDPGTPGRDAMAIARWNAVPFQTFDGTFDVGVLAFHVNGIDRVEFAVDGGPWVSVTESVFNERTGTWEYAVRLDASLFDGPGAVEVRAVVYPSAGVPRALTTEINDESALSGNHSMPLFANPGGQTAGEVYVSLDGDDLGGDGTWEHPYSTIYRAAQAVDDLGGAADADGGRIRLFAGAYTIERPNGAAIPATHDQWLTISPADGVTREEVRIITPDGNPGGGLRVKQMHLNGLTIDGTVSTDSNNETYLWIDDCHIAGAGELDTRMMWSPAWYSAIYATDSVATNCRVAFLVTYARNCLVDTVHTDAFPGVAVLVNSEVKNQVGGYDANGAYLHSDCWQDRVGLTNNNVIIYGLRAVENCQKQGFFSRGPGHHDFAAVNNEFFTTGYPEQNQLATACDHAVIANNNFLGTAFQLRMSDVKVDVEGYQASRNVLWSRNLFQWFNVTDPNHELDLTDEQLVTFAEANSWFEQNHFVNAWPDYADRTGVPYGSDVVGDGATSGASVPDDCGAFGDGYPPPIGRIDGPAGGF